MKKLLGLLTLAVVIALASCGPTDISCGAGTVEKDGQCVRDTGETPLICETGYEEQNGECVLIEDNTVTCESGYHEEGGECVQDPVTCNTGYHEENGLCVIDQVVEVPDWFDDWKLLNEPIGDKSLNDFTFSESGFSVYLEIDKRVGIQQTGVKLEPGYYYEVTFDYTGDVDGKMIFVQLQGHGGHHLTTSYSNTSTSTQTYSDILIMPHSATLTNEGWFTIELLPSAVAGNVTVNNIELIKTALPTCGVNEVLDGMECIAANNGFLPNGTPTAWFTGWTIMQNEFTSKAVSDYDFTETGYTVYLNDGDRTGIELLDYQFESGYTYTFSFDYTASIAGRMIWIQMEALGGFGFTNTDTWTIDGTATFSQSLVIPSTYTPTELGWIKLEIIQGPLDNITIENITITKTPN